MSTRPSATFALPTYGMPCCGHRVVQHADHAHGYGNTSSCVCCRNGRRLANALVLMADESAQNDQEQAR